MRADHSVSDKDAFIAIVQCTGAVLALLAVILKLFEGKKRAKAKGVRVDRITIALWASGWIYVALVKSTVTGLVFLGTADLVLTVDYLRPHAQPTRLDTVVLILVYCLLFSLWNLYLLVQLGNAVVHDLAAKEPIHKTIQKLSP